MITMMQICVQKIIFEKFTNNKYDSYLKTLFLCHPRWLRNHTKKYFDIISAMGKVSEINQKKYQYKITKAFYYTFITSDIVGNNLK